MASMKFFQQPNDVAKGRTPQGLRADALTKDAITLSNGTVPGAFLEAALDLLSAQQPVWIPSPEEILEMQHQQTMLSMMAAIRQGESQGFDLQSVCVPTPQQDHLLLTMQQIVRPECRRIPVQVEFENEFVHLDSIGLPEGDRRVTLGIGSRAIFAKSENSATNLTVPVACLVATIQDGELGIVFHYASTGSASLNIELGAVSQCRLADVHLQLLVQKFQMHEQQVRVFATVIAMQSAAYTQSITSGLVHEICDLYEVDYDGMLRLAVNIEKWRVQQTQPRINF